jgi:hypothetical protein
MMWILKTADAVMVTAMVMVMVMATVMATVTAMEIRKEAEREKHISITRKRKTAALRIYSMLSEISFPDFSERNPINSPLVYSLGSFTPLSNRMEV